MPQTPAKLPRHPANKLEAILEDRVACLADILRDVEQAVHSRRTLSQETLANIDEQYLELKNNLLSLEAWPPGTAQPIDERRMDLEKELGSLTREKRNEQLTCWQDIARLSQETRDRVKEYRDLLQRTRILLPHYTPPKPTYQVPTQNDKHPGRNSAAPNHAPARRGETRG